MYAIRSYYEALTEEHGGLGQGKVPGFAGVYLRQGPGIPSIRCVVITSYSIHYTKLYEEVLINGVLGGSYHYTIVRFDIDLDDIYFKFPEHPPYNILAKPLDIGTL